ncbi:hypothetical protein BTVI_62354 [Pitangus sulphuratus]|nr:hypothetical protein BTVI_62354 [Pitangus sulphuratus]
MPASSRMDFLPLAKAKAIRSDRNASVVTYLRTEGCGTERIPAREEQNENMGTTMQTPRIEYFLQCNNDTMKKNELNNKIQEPELKMVENSCVEFFGSAPFDNCQDLV